MSDRRRINGPASGTVPAVFATTTANSQGRSRRQRKQNELRKIFLQTGIIPAASGSAYLELENPSTRRTIIPLTSTTKLSCSVHGPKPLPRNAAFSANLQLTASVKFSPFANRTRRGYIRDSRERDLGVHLENALKGVILPDRWPKSSIDVAVMVLEGEDDHEVGRGQNSLTETESVGLMNILAGCITVATAALVDARIDCLDLLAGGVAAAVKDSGAEVVMVLDPSTADHDEVLSACVVGYLPSRDEVAEVWSTGSLLEKSEPGKKGFQELLDGAIAAASGAQSVLKEVVMESALRGIPTKAAKGKAKAINDEINDVEMKT